MYTYIVVLHSPADAEKATKVVPGTRSHPAVLADQGQVLAAGGEGELVDGPRPNARPGHGHKIFWRDLRVLKCCQNQNCDLSLVVSNIRINSYLMIE